VLSLCIFTYFDLCVSFVTKFPVLVCKVLPTGENLLQQLPIQLLNLRHLRMAVGWTKQEFPGIACLLRSCPNMERLTLDMFEPVNVDWVGITKLYCLFYKFAGRYCLI
jgi:hypothetical protein